LGDAAPSRLRAWGLDGLIARIESPRLVRQIRRLCVPVVDVLGWHSIPGVPRFGNDREAVVRLAVDHLRGQGLACFAYCGFPGVEFSDRRADFFKACVASLGFVPRVDTGRQRRRQATLAEIEAEGPIGEAALGEWLASLPKPVGVLACNDARAVQVLAACRARGLPVPDAVAVIGVDNDEILCELADPPLTSVELNNARIGYEAAAQLDRLMRGYRPRAEEVRIPPIRVVPRRSTDVLAVADPAVASALRLIRERACEGLAVTDVTAHVHASASTLKRRFAALVGHSPVSEITRVRIDRARYLLVTTTLPVVRIAAMAGFEDAAWFCKQFKRQTGRTPAQYRDDAGTR
jgi:LacI family transcriptional regulator